MPLPLAAALAIGGSVLQSGMEIYQNEANRNAQARINQQNQAFAREMYDRQRTDALSDWERTNQYNSPVEQMNRLRQAGLNPNLIYGKGAENTAAMVRSSSAPTANSVAPHLDYSKTGDLVNRYLAIRQQNVQTDNLFEQTALLRKEQLLKDAMTAKTLKETAKTDFELSQSKRLSDLVVKRAELENQESLSRLKRTDAEINALDVTNFTKLSENERQQLTTEQNLKIGIIKMLEMRKGLAKTDQEINQLTQAQKLTEQMLKKGENDILTQEYDQYNRRKGIQSNDNFLFRRLGEFMDNLQRRLDKWKSTHY